MLSPNSGHIDTSLTNVSVMYRNAKFVSEDVFPVIPVQKQSNKFFVYGVDNLRVQNDARRPGSKANEITWNLSANPYYCDGHALNQIVPDEDRENFDAAIDLDTDTTIQLTDMLFLNREINLVNSLTAALTPTDLSASAYANAWDTVGVDPVAAIDKAKETIAQIGMRPNTMLMSRPVFRGVRNNALVKSRISGAPNLPASYITPAALASVLEVDELIVADAVQVTSAEGITPVTTSYVWGRYALLFYKPPSPGLRTVSLGYQFTWNTGRLGSLVYRFREDSRHADLIEVMRYYDNRVVSANAGYMWSNATQN